MRITKLLAATALSGAAVAAPTSAWAQATPNVSNPATSTARASNTQAETPGDAEEQQKAASADGTVNADNTVVVTGSRIRRPETDGVLPGVQVTAQSIETRGFTNALEALNDIPLVGPGASPLNGNNGGQTASLGAAFVDLLDLGTARTLTLVNGRRFVSGNSASLFVAGNETGSQVDVNVIPSTLIERIDVVTVGGAAAYGADAIAGVVNYILKDNFSGLQLRGLSGIAERGDAGQYQLSALAGRNFLDGRANLTLSAEYDRNDGLQATSRDFRVVRPGSYTNPFNGGVRNPNFSPTQIIDVTNLNNGAFLRASDDGQPATLFGLGLVTQTLSNPGTVLNVASNSVYNPAACYTAYPNAACTLTPITSGAGATLRTSNYIELVNGISPVGFALNATTTTGARTTISSVNNGYYNTAGQVIQGTPGVGLALGTLSGNGLNGRTTQAANVPFTTFAPTALPTNVTAAQVFATYGVTPPTGATTAQQNTIAVNILQANRFTAREFLSANPGVNLNYFVGTFAPDVPRVANTDTTLVNVKVNGGTVQVPVNQVLPFRAVPLEFNDDGSLREYTFSGPVSGNDPLTIGSSRGGNGGFRRSLENTVLRTQQDRYIFNLNGKIDVTDQVTFFTENVYANVLNRSLGNISGAQNFLTTSQENAPLLLNYNNPYLTAQDRTVLASVGVQPGNGTNNGNFVITRQNQDIFGANAYTNREETYRIVAGVRSKFQLLSHDWNAEVSGTYGNAKQNTRSYGIADVEYQLALDAVDTGLATTGVANGNITCRAKLFPNQYLGKTPVGTAENITRVRGADGLPTEVLITPTITQALIDSCQPLNPFGYNQMSAASKAYVTSPSLFRNVSQQTFIQSSVGGGLFDLPAGMVSINANGEYRREQLDFTTNDLNILGRSRSAPSANTSGLTETYEVGGEAAIPLTGPDFLGFLGRLEFRPAVRVSEQSGHAGTYRSLAGQVISPRANGDPTTIYSLAGTWAPIRDIQIRGNYTRSVRQPSIVELFLGGQPVFTTPTDYCSVANIDAGPTGGRRRTNCVAAVIANGNATDTAGANAFLTNFVASGAGLQGTYSGSPTLLPEKGKSWTAGAVLAPRFLPGLSLSADYIQVRVDGTIVPVGLGTFVQSCYDSPTYPDTTPQIGLNGCANFSRDPTFQLQNGFRAGFLNLGALKVQAVNISGDYTFRFGSDRLVFRGNAYRLIAYDVSNTGLFDDTFHVVGTPDEPRWRTQLSARYEHQQVYGQVTWNRKDPTRIFNASGVVANGENYPYTRFPAQHNVDIALGIDVNERFRFQLNVANLLDQTTAGDLGYRYGSSGPAPYGASGIAYPDQIGRRFQATVTTRY